MRLLSDTQALPWWLEGHPWLAAAVQSATGHVSNAIHVSAALASKTSAEYRIDRLPGAVIVRGADMDVAPQATGLPVASLGLSRLYTDNHAQLDAAMALFSALCRWAHGAHAEIHKWPAPTPETAR